MSFVKSRGRRKGVGDLVCAYLILVFVLCFFFCANTPLNGMDDWNELSFLYLWNNWQEV